MLHACLLDLKAGKQAGLYASKQVYMQASRFICKQAGLHAIKQVYITMEKIPIEILPNLRIGLPNPQANTQLLRAK